MSKETVSPNKKKGATQYLINTPSPNRDDFLMDIVDQFIKRRQGLNLSQEQVDLIMGNADRQCSKWECGVRTPTSFNLLCWAEALKAKILLTPD